MKLITASANRELDEILDLLVTELQLTASQFEDARAKYGAVSKWLNEEGCNLEPFRPDIFPQGSMRCDTTVRPLQYTEFDLDLVCQLDMDGSARPAEVYDLLLDRMRMNGRYKDKLDPKPRCIRVNYAGQFHLDIVPTIPDPDCAPGETCLMVPDRAMLTWRPTNPKGYAEWLNRQCMKEMQTKAARFGLREGVEPLKAPAPAYSKPVLKLAVQLIKRWRDVAFRGREHLAPSSIVLTTLCGHLYRGEIHPTDAMANILEGIKQWADSETIVLMNPTNDKECISDRWREKPETYDAFVESVGDFREKWTRLIEDGQFPELVSDLKQLFESVPVSRALTKFAENRREARQRGNLLVEPSTGVLTTAPAVGAAMMKVKDHTFHGG